MNSIGNGLLRGKRFQEAVEISKLNTIEYRNSYNVYDNLGEAYMKLVNNELAILNY